VQRAGARDATGSLALEGIATAARLGMLQTTDDWASVGFEHAGRAMRATIDLAEPGTRGTATVIVEADGTRVFRGSLSATAVEIK
jgi:hypothetical protein